MLSSRAGNDRLQRGSEGMEDESPDVDIDESMADVRESVVEL